MVRNGAPQLEPVPRVTKYPLRFFFPAAAPSRAAEAVLPGVLPWGAFLAVVLRKPDTTK